MKGNPKCVFGALNKKIILTDQSVSMQKKENLILTSIRLFAERGFHNTSTSRIAGEAGVASGLIFHHFKNKEGLLLAVIEYLRDKIEGVLFLHPKGDPSTELEHLKDRLLSVKKEQSFWTLYHSLLFQPALTEIMKTQLRDTFDQYLSALKSIFAQLKHSDPVQSALQFEAQRSGIILAYLLQGDSYPLQDLLSSLFREYSTKK